MGMGVAAALLYGALGGILPTIARLGGTFVSVPATPWPELGLWFGLLCFAFVGAVIALAAGRAEIKQAIFAGIAAPGIITNVVAGVAESRSSHAELLSMVSTANAQEDHSGTRGGDFFTLEQKQHIMEILSRRGAKSITISPTVNGGLPNAIDIPVAAATTETDKPSETEWFPIGSIRTLSGKTEVVVPNGTRHLKIGGKTVTLAADQSNIALDVSTKPTSDFLWALGAPRTYEIKSLSTVQ